MTLTAREASMYAALHAAVQILDNLRAGYFTEEGEVQALNRLYNILGGERDMISEDLWSEGS